MYIVFVMGIALLIWALTNSSEKKDSPCQDELVKKLREKPKEEPAMFSVGDKVKVFLDGSILCGRKEAKLLKGVVLARKKTCTLGMYGYDIKYVVRCGKQVRLVDESDVFPSEEEQ